MSNPANTSTSLYARDGQRKYLTPSERARFVATAETWPRAEIGTLCLILAFTGCRISEALATRRAAVDVEHASLAIRSLKKRGAFVVREVPLPTRVVARLQAVHELDDRDAAHRLWPLCRSRAWQLIKTVMDEAGIGHGPHATPKGLRHAFGVHAIRCGVPLHLVQRWLGHASLATTAIYTQALGAEEREIAARMWKV